FSSQKDLKFVFCRPPFISTALIRFSKLESEDYRKYIFESFDKNSSVAHRIATEVEFMDDQIVMDYLKNTDYVFLSSKFLNSELTTENKVVLTKLGVLNKDVLAWNPTNIGLVFSNWWDD